MKFELSTTGSHYDSEQQKKKLEKLGFLFEEIHENPMYIDKRKTWYLGHKQLEIEINTLEELIEFSNKYGDLIVSENRIEIYDDYRE